jgi:putative transposase
MPRGPRLDAPGALHHAIARGIERSPIFLDDVDRNDFLDRLAGLGTARHLIVYAWSLMTNHIHLLVRTGNAPLSRSMQSLLGGYASAFNSRHQRVGYLFQSRFKSIMAEDDPYLLALLCYIHLNPLRAAMVADLDALDHCQWTGHGVLLGHHKRPWQDTAFVLSQFGTHVAQARRAYRAFVAKGFAQPEPDLDGGGLRRSLGVWQTLGSLARGRERWAFDERILGRNDFVTAAIAVSDANHPPLSAPVDPSAFVREVLRYVAAQFDLRIAEVTTNTRRRAAVRARALVSYAAVRNAGLPARRVAPLLGISPRTVLQGVAHAQRRFPPSALADPRLRPVCDLRR